MSQAGKFLKVEVIDHLIISDETYHSFVESGIFKKLQASERWILPYKVKGTLKNSRCFCRTRKPRYIRVRNSMIIKAFEKRDL